VKSLRQQGVVLSLIAGLALALSPQQALRAQPVDLPIPAASATELPPGVTIRRTAAGPVYADARGRTLYGMDMRTLIRWSPNPALHCQDTCAAQWEPVLAPAEAKVNIAFPRGGGAASRTAPPGFVLPQTAPDWTVIAGAQGPQWVYKGWHMVFVRKGDRPGSTAFDGAENLTWNTLKYVPPRPTIAAPPGVTTVFASGAYHLADREGRVLFTGDCGKSCEGWTPLAAPMASLGLGEWTVDLAHDTPQWSWRGNRVFVSRDADPVSVPRKGKVMRP
jgi:predicted lipoprotein with Yx(FWY)xxD motif